MGPGGEGRENGADVLGAVEGICRDGLIAQQAVDGGALAGAADSDNHGRDLQQLLLRILCLQGVSCGWDLLHPAGTSQANPLRVLKPANHRMKLLAERQWTAKLQDNLSKPCLRSK